MSDFVHLHNHTHYSLLDAMATPKDLLEAAKDDNQPAIALTDHGVMFGCLEFTKLSKKIGVKPIIGMEAYVANGTRFDKNLKTKDGRRKKNYFHLVMLAKNEVGYKNLLKLTTLGHTEGFYYKPRIDRELVEKYSEGIIVSSACIGGVVNNHLVNDDMEAAMEDARFYQRVFGEDFYLEIQNHFQPADKIILDKVPQIAKELGIKMIATNDIHYMKKEHAVAHNVLLLIRDSNAANSGQANIYDLRYKTPEFYFKTQAEMKDIFKEYPEALENTLEIADKCNYGVETGKIYMPEFPIPEESKAENLDEYLTELTWKGIKEKYDVITDEIKARTEYELGVIINMKFPGYFLITQDFINAAKDRGVRVGPGRGSAAGSIVAYALGITNIDPIPYHLLFERFLNPERVNMPDVDIDFADDKRDIVIEYVKDAYGEEAVCQIITFGKLSSKAVLTDVGRVLGIELNKIREITKAIPVNGGKVTPVAKAVDLPELEWLKKTDDPKLKELVEFSKLLEGKFRQTGIHAAGVVIAPGPVANYVPVHKSAKAKESSVEITSQYSMADIEDAGLLKMDFLGLRTLSIIENTLTMVKDNHGVDIDIDKIDFKDQATYDLLGQGKTLSIFQFESGGMQEYLKQLKPQNLEEITAMNALYRPGPMANIPDFIDRKFGRKPIEYLHPIMEKSLKNTYGIIVYQEQVMQLVQHIADFSLGQADLLRRAMGKKKIDIMEQQKPLFVEGAAKKGITEKLALEIFDLIVAFASYGFNKSHSVAYSYVAYQTAWLKTHYPAEFLAANMTAELNDQAKIVLLTEEAKRFGITVLPPDVNRSFANFRAVGNEIYFGMAGIRNVGIKPVESIIEARNEKKFESFFDFVSRVDTRLCNRKAIESLIYAGAFDSLEAGHRAQLIASVDEALEYAKAKQESTKSNMDSLFGGESCADLKEPTLPQIKPWDKKYVLEKEMEVLKFYISGHPMEDYVPYWNSVATFKLDERNIQDKSQVRIVAMITEMRTKLDKKNRTMAFLNVEDVRGKAEVIFWSNTYEKCHHALQKDSVVVIEGKVEINDENVKIIADTAFPVSESIDRFAKGYSVWIDRQSVTEDKIKSIYDKFKQENAKSLMHFYVYDESKDYKKHYFTHETNIPVNEEVLNGLVEMLGIYNVKLALV